jgi:hypothetical protein
MNVIISSFLTQNNEPALGLLPTIRIWKITETSQTLVVPGSGPELTMTEVGDGFYKFDFTDTLGFNSLNTYVARIDGGVALDSTGERFQAVNIDLTTAGNATITPTDISTIVNGVWDATATNHMVPGTMGSFQNETHADAQQTYINVTTAINLMTTLLKYERNRTRIDKSAMTLTVYDDDGITPIEVFNLRDSTGSPSVTEVCERLPV